MGDGDGWVVCDAGHRHWGRFGAAGLLLSERDRAVLQHRAPNTHEGDTWGLPGGARDSHEDAVTAALREAHEEAAIAASAVLPVGLSVDDHGGWSYTTVAARPVGQVHPRATNWESADIRWWPVADIPALRLHPGFAASWPRLRRTPAPMSVVVDAANVVGSVPDGWWRDRAAAATRLLAGLARLAADGVPAADLPVGSDTGGLTSLLPELVAVLEGAARAAREPAGATRLTLSRAEGAGDDAVLAAVAAAVERGHQTVAVTADRALRARLPATTLTVGPSWLSAKAAPGRDAP